MVLLDYSEETNYSEDDEDIITPTEDKFKEKEDNQIKK